VSLHVDIRQEGASRSALHVAQLGERAANPRPAFERIAREMERNEQVYFRSRGAGKWAPLSIETEAYKAAEGQGSVPLVASGRLRDSLTRARVTPHSVSIGTEVPYARFHQYGTRRMPARPPIMPASPRLSRMARDEVSRYVVEGKR
jgi:phage gpG-like protein